MFLRKKKHSILEFAVMTRSTLKIQHLCSGGIVARINAVHEINSIPAWDRLHPISAGDVMKQ